MFLIIAAKILIIFYIEEENGEKKENKCNFSWIIKKKSINLPHQRLTNESR